MEQNELVKKNWLLTTLCLLTFIGSGFGLIVSILSMISLDFIYFTQDIIGYTSVLTNTQDASFGFIIAKTALYILILYAAYQMLNRKRKGFWLYIAGQVLLIIISFLFFPYPYLVTFSIVIPEIIFSVAFIFLYAIQYNEMKNR